MNKVFIDTGAWIGCIDSSDSYHKKAANYLRKLRNEKAFLISSNFILDETITWVKYNLGHKKAVKVKKLWDKIESNGLLQVYLVDQEISESAWKIFCKYDDHNLSFTDCTSFAISQKYEISKIFGFDNDFNTLGFLLSPDQIREKEMKYQILKP